MHGRLHSRSRDRAAISHHYDASNDFYRLILDPSMAYSCAYWESPQANSTLAQAQSDKLDRICHKVGLNERPGLRGNTTCELRMHGSQTSKSAGTLRWN
jgi:cyclopropane-fatty-acyl-phospholipid synthase